MKKIFYLVIGIIAVSTIFTACNKEGVYSPKKKISKIYEESVLTTQFKLEDKTPKYLKENWTWDGKKLINIDYYSMNGELNGNSKLEYDGKRIKKITNYEDGEIDNTWTFIYEKNKLKSMDNDYPDGYKITYNITHDGKKITQISYNINDEYGYGKGDLKHTPNTSPLKLFLPEVVYNTIVRTYDSKFQPKQAKSLYQFTFEWDGDNISKMIYPDKEYSTYTYDKKKNPFYGLYEYEYGNYATILSKNNITSETYNTTENGTTVALNYTYSYTYENNWPTICVFSFSFDGISVTTTTYYEYK